MLEPKTHFEQVPLDVVRKMVEEQIRRETATEQDQRTKKNNVGRRYFEGAGKMHGQVPHIFSGGGIEAINES